MRSLFAGLVGAVSLLATAALAAPEPVLDAAAPAWVKPLPPLKTEPPVTGAPYRQLRLDQQVHFGPEGDSIYVESITRIQTAQGLSAMGTIALPWNPDSTTLTVHKLEIRRGTQVIDVLADQTFTVLRRENRLEYAMLDGVLTATMQPEGLEVGDIVTLAITLIRRDAVIGDFSENYLPAPPTDQIDQVQLRVLWDPKAKPIRYRLDQGLNPPKVGKTSSGETELLFDLKGQKAYKPPTGAPARYLRGRGVEFTQFKDWAQVSALMAPLYDTAATLKENSRLKPEIDKIRAASSDPKVQAGLALSLVQERTRYVFLGMDAGNLTPAQADMTWSRRYGDCKGKTALLLAILRELGIKAEPAIVHSTLGDGLDSRLPMVGLFDHVIVRAEIAGKVYWLDGTRNGDRKLEDVAIPEFAWALPLRAKGGSLEALRVEPSPLPTTALTLDIDASGGLYSKAPMKAEQRFRGDYANAARANADAATPEDLEKTYRKYWQTTFDFAEIDKVSSRYDEATGEYVFAMEGKANLDWNEKNESSAPRHLTFGHKLGGPSSWKREDDVDNKDAPFGVTHPLHVWYRETIRLPDGGKGYVSEGKDIDQVTAGYSFWRKAGIKDGVFTLETRTRSLQTEVAASEAEANQKALADMGEIEVYLVAPPGYRWSNSDRASRIADMDKVLKENPKSVPALQNRAWLHRENKDYARAEADYNTAIGFDDDNALLYTMRAGALLRLGRKEAAMSDFASARKHAGADAGDLNALCWEQATNGVALEAALRDCDKALQIEPRNAAIVDSRGFVLMRLGRWSDSIADYNKAADIRPDSAESLFGRALAKAGAGDKAGAAADLAEARKLDAGIDEEFGTYGLKAP
jgi:tetratricopeptide (TPR) repeat protein